MSWKIVSMEKPAGDLKGYEHNYVALVDDAGRIVEEYHGWYGDHFSMPFMGPDSDNFLIGREVEPHKILNSVPNVLLTSDHTVDIRLDDGTIAKNIAKVLKEGDENDMREKWRQGIFEVESVLMGGKFLYESASLFHTAINSNSVWWTFLMAIGADFPPADYLGGPSPGRQDLRASGSNNPKFGNKDEATIYRDQKAKNK
jgi:hypothetical protein